MNICKIAVCALVAAVMPLLIGSSVSAHVTVQPAEALTASRQVFTVGVPNEKDVPTTQVRLLIPANLSSVMPFQKAGWDIAVERQGRSDDAKVTAITWQGNTVGVGFRDAFTFSAKLPEKSGVLQWKAYQTYADGTIVAWDKATADDGHSGNAHSGPFSVTDVVVQTEADARVAQAQAAADRSRYLGVAGIVAGLLGVFFATRKKAAGSK